MSKIIYGNVVGANNQKKTLFVKVSEKLEGDDGSGYYDPSAPTYLVADYTPSQIYEYIQNGWDVYFITGSAIIPVSHATPIHTEFVYYTGTIYMCFCIGDDGIVNIESVDRPDMLIVIVGNDGEASHTSEEIFEHVSKGGNVLFKKELDNIRYTQLLYADPYNVVFGHVELDSFDDNTSNLISSTVYINRFGEVRFDYYSNWNDVYWENYIYEQISNIPSGGSTVQLYIWEDDD